MNKEELELYDMVLNSKKSFDVNYKELAISLRAELKETEDRIQKAIEYIKENADNNCTLIFAEELLDILKGSDKDIPGFEGTLEELDNLSIRGNNDK